MDREVRQSMALDLMEPVRPAVENFVLKLLAPFSAPSAVKYGMSAGDHRL
jgi:CRISPR/Cas system-associated endonuclease Cas1